MTSFDRRTFVAATGAIILQGGTDPAISNNRIAEPFTLGVASGEPTPDGVVLWTRLAPEPLEPDGQGGMGTRDVDVRWQLATDDRFRNIVKQGTEVARHDDAHSVHAEPRGLRPGTEYFYRFRVQGHISPVGSTRTAPAHRSNPDRVRFAIASCQNFESGWYHPYKFMVDDRPDLILFLGDYIYDRAHKGIYARHYTESWQSETLSQFRRRYAENRSRDEQLRVAHAVAPWLVVFDDHEVSNDWNSEQPAAEVKASAMKAFWEHMPLGSAHKPANSNMRLYRRRQWGSLARFHMLDTRQYRDPQVGGDIDCDVVRKPSRTIVGADQEAWLLSAFEKQSAVSDTFAAARWDFLGQQVPFAVRDDDGDPATCDVDRDENDMWDGYPAVRDRLVNGWMERRVRNMTVLTGDIHSHWANDIPSRLGGPIAGSEIIGTSVTSPYVEDDPSDELLRNSPHLRFVGSDKRGYVRMIVVPGELKAEFVSVSDVLEPDIAKVTAKVTATYVAEDRRPGLQLA